MEVTRSNFKDSKSEFLTHLETADFISFDLETTGLKSEERTKTDLPFENYYKTYHAANKYAIIQMGLCIYKAKPCATLDETEPSYLQKDIEFEAFPFTFYLFPRTYDGLMLRDVGMEVSSIQYNVFKHKIDWNKWLAQGVGYYDREEREYLRNVIFSDKGVPGSQLSNSQLEQIESIMAGFQVWYQSPATLKVNLKGILEQKLDNDPKAYIIKDLPISIKKALRDQIRALDSNLFIQDIFSEENKNNDYKVLKLSEHALSGVKNLIPKIRKKLYQDAIGFSYIWECIQQKIKTDNIPVVGHDCMSDLSFWYAHLEGNLNPDYQWFKAEVGRMLSGGIFDTRCISATLEMDRQMIQTLHDERDEDDDHYIHFADSKFDVRADPKHTAGKVAYMTGFAFLEMVRNLDTTLVNSFLNIVNINPNVLYHYDFGSIEKDYPRSNKVWTIVLRDKEAAKLRVKNNCIDKKGKIIQSN